MSVFHRIEDIYTMDAALFFRRAQCLTAYDGAVAAQSNRQQDEVSTIVNTAVQGAVDEEAAAWARHRAKRWPGQEVTIVSPMQALSEAAGRG